MESDDFPHFARIRRSTTVLILALAGVGCGLFGRSGGEGCPDAMARIPAGGSVPHTYCIDRWEGSVVEIRGGDESPHAPAEPVTNLSIKAVSNADVIPQGHISKVEAEAACKKAGKRLCTGDEWTRACRGERGTTFPYGNERKPGQCNDSGSAVSPTGSHARCTNTWGVHDMVGNLHEWTSEVHGAHGVFRGGYYKDTHLNGDGCTYKTVVHDVTYFDYSTSFRCCANAR